MDSDAVNIRDYSEANKASVIELLADLQKHIADLDEFGVNKILKDFDASAYMADLQMKLEKHSGRIFIAEENAIVLGCIAVTIHDDPESVDHYAHTSGFIDELIVFENSRGKRIGNLLMERAERLFKEKGCRFSRTDCFSANNRAHAFYEKLGYKDRYVNLIKPLS